MHEILKYIAGIAAVCVSMMAAAFVIVTAFIITCYTYLFGGWESYFKTEQDYICLCDAIELIFETPDSSITCKDLHMDPSSMYRITRYSIEHGKDSVTICESEDSTFKYDEWRPLFVHRINGRIDTLCSRRRDGTWVGYIQRKYKDDNWLIVEAKQPDKILGNTHLVDKRSVNRGEHYMCDYDFEGQIIVFNSKLSDYWIASLNSPDLYGPMNIKELKRIGTSLRIEFPLTLESNVDHYACPKEINGLDVSDKYRDPREPKSLSDWYHVLFTRKPDRVIK